MESVESKLGYYPKCPHCKVDKGFDVTLCPHTVGVNGVYELVSCQACKVLITATCVPNLD
jgi:hypothetical protein